MAAMENPTTALHYDTRQLLKCLLGDFTGLVKNRQNKNEPLSTMKRVVEELLKKQSFAYSEMIKKLSLDDREGDVRTVVGAVARTVFADGVNWGRVASLAAFGTAVCLYLKDKGVENCVEQVGEEISSYLLTNQKDWLISNNSWDGFVEFFREPESRLRSNRLGTFAVGIGAILALCIVRIALYNS